MKFTFGNIAQTLQGQTTPLQQSQICKKNLIDLRYERTAYTPAATVPLNWYRLVLNICKKTVAILFDLYQRKINYRLTYPPSKAGSNFYRPLMSLGGEKVFAHLSWKQSKKSAFGEIIFHYFPVFRLFKRGRKCVVGNWQEWPNASNCWWGNWNPCCRINVDNPIEFPSWQELANHQILWKYKKNTKIKLCQSQLPHSKVCFKFAEWSFDLGGCHQLQLLDKCLQSTFDRDDVTPHRFSQFRFFYIF